MFTYTNFYRFIFLFLVHDAVPPSPARSITKQPTALLSLSKTYEFYEQEPWGGESPDKEDSS